MLFRNQPGIAGFFPWVGWRPETVHLWSATIRAQRHMNGDDVIGTLSEGGGNWGHGKEEEELYIVMNQTDNHILVPAIEHQYYMSNTNSSTVGYIKNRTYNIHTKRLNDNCDLDYGNIEPIDELEDITWNDVRLFPINRRLRVKDLKYNASYRIDYYSFKTGNYLSTQCDNTTANRNYIVLEYPELKTKDSSNENPVIWYVIQHNGCSQGMIQVNSESNPLSDSLIKTLKIEEILERERGRVKIYPNPFENSFTIDSPQSDLMVIETIDGRTVLERNINENITHISVPNISKGTYVIKFIKQNIEFKVIKL